VDQLNTKNLLNIEILAIKEGLFASATFGIHRHDTGSMEDDARSTGDDTLHWKACFRVLGERGLGHLLLDLESAGFFAWGFWNGFVDISRHDAKEFAQ